jgi:hypothetical protein
MVVLPHILPAALMAAIRSFRTGKTVMAEISDKKVQIPDEKGQQMVPFH